MKRIPSRSNLQQVEKKQGEAKWRKVVRPSSLAIMALFIMFMLFLCNMVVNDPYSGVYEPCPTHDIQKNWDWGQESPSVASSARGTVWTTGVFRSNPHTAMDMDISGPLTRAESGEGINQQPLREGAEALPKGIVESTTDLELRHLWMSPDKDTKTPQNLLAMAVGIKQKRNVNRIIQKFPANNFTVMLFHYDGNVNDWIDLAWTARAIHVMAFNQTKWWFAKRFLHPDVVQKYNFIFLWDEDLGVEHFHASRYLEIMEEEGLEISQPALHRNSSEVHHQLTRWNRSARAHRRTYSYTGRTQCDAQSTGPPCTGWVEMMAPVFSHAAWRCTWHMIQNDLIHAWGLDYKLGYCAQGIRSERVGIIDAEFIVHEGIPSLGGSPRLKIAQAPLVSEDNDFLPGKRHLPANGVLDVRGQIRKRAGAELDVFARRWRRSASSDPDWKDPYKQPELASIEVAPQQHRVNNQEMRPIAVELVEKKKKRKPKQSTANSSHRRIL